jgi:hypothetical protein
MMVVSCAKEKSEQANSTRPKRKFFIFNTTGIKICNISQKTTALGMMQAVINQSRYNVSSVGLITCNFLIIPCHRIRIPLIVEGLFTTFIKPVPVLSPEGSLVVHSLFTRCSLVLFRSGELRGRYE